MQWEISCLLLISFYFVTCGAGYNYCRSIISNEGYVRSSGVKVSKCNQDEGLKFGTTLEVE